MTLWFTTGYVFRNGMLKNHLGQPYSQRANVARIAKTLKHKVKATAYGNAIYISQAEIDKWNNHWPS